ncbi:flagellar hook-associated protein FlgK [uncultured Tissierella sp.]|uniref:flagellar hook-associated protein FlgK n=1 Tax=uncultured Tissierella sp. TaxID=448160 RepID=UPI0028039401|nr:flagellar hook-associated protein FlgK [uncultured Tissierella sp.]MDU5079775.1 flagellar hook-associated protein FlgK [Bacillota bacterium]
MGFGGLYISISGLQASRKSLDTVSHNISNANNPNYVRQSAIHASNSYTKSADGRFQTGTGVNVIQIRQIRDEFLDLKLRRENASFGYHYAKAQILEDIEGVFNEITDSGLQKVMDGLWKNWDELSKEADSLTIRGLVHESSVAFAETVNHISRQLNDIRHNLNKQMLTKVDEVNNILDKIGELNKSIKLVEGENSRMKANDFRDERNALIDRLSELLPITSYENTFGETIISLQGRDIVNGSFISRIDIKNDNNGLGHIYWEKSNEKIDLNGLGELAGFIDVRDKSMVEYMNRLDTFVQNLANEINALHSTGIDLEGNKGGDFFVGSGGVINASNIKVNPELSNYNKIAISITGGISDGDIAKGIYELRNKTIFGEMSTDDYYRDIIFSLGEERKSSRLIAENQGFLINTIDERRQSISAVSLDEEMADMIKFQHSYTANSRVINAIDEMIETVVNRVGLVGR